MLKIKKGGTMPRGDRTGPDGFGPMTGRGFGFCSGFNSPGYTRGGGFGRGYGRGFGRGRGFRGMGYVDPYYYNPYPKVNDSEESLKEEITSVEKYLNELKEMIRKKEEEK